MVQHFLTAQGLFIIEVSNHSQAQHIRVRLPWKSEWPVG